jgi:uncharacterized protein YceK
MNKVTKLTGLALASAAAALLLSGCGTTAEKADGAKAEAKVEAKAANSCKGKDSCKGKSSCKGANGCKGK